MKGMFSNRSRILVLVLIGLAVAFPALSQKKTKGKPAQVTKKASDSRLTPPANRKFNHSLELTANYDRFENNTHVQLRIPANSVEVMYMDFGFTGEVLKHAPQAILFQYFADSRKLTFLTPKEAIFLTDRDRFRIKLIPLPELENGKVPFVASIDYATFLKIANGKTVAFKVGETENYFDEEGLEALKDFASRTNPKANRSSEIAETNAIKKDVMAEVAKLNRLTPRAKAQIKETLDYIELVQIGLKKATSSEPADGDGIRLMGNSASGLLKGIDAVPSGTFKQLLQACADDLFSAIIIAGGKVGVFDSRTAEFKRITKEAFARNKLDEFPDKDHVSILLSKSEEALFHAKTIASAAKIIEPE